MGPTASGKSDLALEVARRTGAHVVSADSMQVYAGMDIGTAKPTARQRAEIPHHLLDVCQPEDDFSVVDFARLAANAMTEAEALGAPVVVVGGTGLYVSALVDGLRIPERYPAVRKDLEADADTTGLHRRLQEMDPVAAARMEPTNRRRVIRALEVCLGSGRPFSSYGPGLDVYRPNPQYRLMGVSIDRSELDARIDDRFDRLMERGLLQEVERLAPRLGRTASQALGYKELAAHLRGEVGLADAVDEAKRRTRRFARRQQRWFARDPRIAWSGFDDNPLVVADMVLGESDLCS